MDTVDTLASLHKQQRYSEMESIAEIALRDGSHSAMLWNLFGVAKFAQGKDALDAFQRAVTLAPQNADFRCNLAVTLSSRKFYAEAFEAFKAATQISPNNAHYYLGCGSCLQNLDRHDEAASWFKKAASIDEGEISPSKTEIDLLLDKFNGGDHAGAEVLARGITNRFPGHVLGWNVLGLSLYLRGRSSEALGPMKRAVDLAPFDAMLRSNLGAALNQAGLAADAEYQLREAIRINPDLADAHNNLGIVLRKNGLKSDAESCFKEALRLNPNYVEAHDNLGNLFEERDRLSLAEQCFKKAIELNPRFQNAHSSLGKVLRKLGRLDEAEAACRFATKLNSTSSYAQLNLGNVLRELGRLRDAEECYLRAMNIAPNDTAVRNNLGVVLQEQNRLAEAESQLRHSLGISPDNANTHCYLAGVLKDQGKMNEALTSFREALRINPGYFDALSGLLFSLNYVEELSASAALAEAMRFGDLAREKAVGTFSTWNCEPDPEKIRVALVSGDLRNHPVGYFLEGILGQLRSSSIELVAFSASPKVDELTLRIKPYFKAWFSIYGVSDHQAAQMIHDAAPHILIDLSGHTAHNRLPVFAYRPAPIQATWLGYFSTTGLAAMDYIIASPHLVPHNEENHFVEKVWRLPETSVCFTSPGVTIEVSKLPALNNGFITFGCFNNLTKMNERVVSVWSKILHRVPGSKLFLKTKQFDDRAAIADVIAAFGAHGISESRLLLEGQSPRLEYLAAYHRIDIALDPFPFPGGTTSAEALWMGIPVLTLKGDRFISHQGEAIAHNVGLSNWIAENLEDYVAKAQRFAADIQSLAYLRFELREKVLKSPLFDAERFRTHFENAMWGMSKEQRGAGAH